MAKFILAFKRILNLIKLSFPAQDEISSLNNDECILYVLETNETTTLNGVTNTNEIYELASGN